MMADPHSTGIVCLSKTPTPPFVRTGPLYARQHGNIFWIREPDPPGYHTPIADAARVLAQNVRLERVMRGWSQETLAELAGLNRSFVGAIERYEHNITLATLEKLAKAFELRVFELLMPHTFNS